MKRKVKMPEVPFRWDHFSNTDEPGGIEEMQRFGQAIVEMLRHWRIVELQVPQVYCFYVEHLETLVAVLIAPRDANKKNLKKIEKWCTRELEIKEEEEAALDEAEQKDLEKSL